MARVFKYLFSLLGGFFALRLRSHCWLLLFVVTLAPAARSADILSMDIASDKGTYTMTSEVWFDATIEQVFEVYQNWGYSTRFSSAIVEARDMEPDEEGRAQFYVRNKGCIFFFCQSFERQGYVESERNLVLRAFANPETSDFHHSNESWKFLARDGGTVVTYDLTISPKFWIPPGIGPFLIKRKLKDNGGRAVDRIEIIAQELDVE